MLEGIDEPGMSTAEQNNETGPAFHHQGLVIVKRIFGKAISVFK